MDMFTNGMTLDYIVGELQQVSDDLVKRSLSQYVAYSLKEEQALAFLADPEADVPNLTAEAKIRNVSVEELAKLVKEKAAKMRSIVSNVELLRLELISSYQEAPDKLALRSEILNRIKVLAQ